VSLGAHQLSPNPGSVKSRKRVGRGNASGHGTYSGRGLKGQKSRSGKKIRLTFEGGQMPLVRKLGTMRGFNNKWRVPYQPVNVAALDRFDAGTDVTPELLREVGILKHRFSKAARAKIEEAGGTVTELNPAKSPEGEDA
jgi:large subunit ribosomal protein L15